jgi:hypothetical protein
MCVGACVYFSMCIVLLLLACAGGGFARTCVCMHVCWRVCVFFHVYCSTSACLCRWGVCSYMCMCASAVCFSTSTCPYVRVHACVYTLCVCLSCQVRVKQQSGRPIKSGSIEKVVNKNLVFLVMLLFLNCATGAIGDAIWRTTYRTEALYLMVSFHTHSLTHRRSRWHTRIHTHPHTPTLTLALTPTLTLALTPALTLALTLTRELTPTLTLTRMHHAHRSRTYITCTQLQSLINMNAFMSHVPTHSHRPVTCVSRVLFAL